MLFVVVVGAKTTKNKVTDYMFSTCSPGRPVHPGWSRHVGVADPGTRIRRRPPSCFLLHKTHPLKTCRGNSPTRRWANNSLMLLNENTFLSFACQKRIWRLWLTPPPWSSASWPRWGPCRWALLSGWWSWPAAWESRTAPPSAWPGPRWRAPPAGRSKSRATWPGPSRSAPPTAASSEPAARGEKLWVTSTFATGSRTSRPDWPGRVGLWSL